MYYTVIKHDGHLRTQGKNVRSVLSQCNARIRLLHLLYNIDFMRANNKTRFFYVLYSDKTWVFDQSEHVQGPIYVIKFKKKACFVKQLQYYNARNDLSQEIISVLSDC